jgi:hypothetical protein
MVMTLTHVIIGRLDADQHQQRLQVGPHRVQEALESLIELFGRFD